MFHRSVINEMSGPQKQRQNPSQELCGQLSLIMWLVSLVKRRAQPPMCLPLCAGIMWIHSSLPEMFWNLSQEHTEAKKTALKLVPVPTRTTYLCFNPQHCWQKAWVARIKSVLNTWHERTEFCTFKRNLFAPGQAPAAPSTLVVQDFAHCFPVFVWHDIVKYGVYRSPEVEQKHGDEVEVLCEVIQDDFTLGEEDSADVEWEPTQHKGQNYNSYRGRKHTSVILSRVYSASLNYLRIWHEVAKFNPAKRTPPALPSCFCAVVTGNLKQQELMVAHKINCLQLK